MADVFISYSRRDAEFERLPPAWTNAEEFGPDGSRLALDEGGRALPPARPWSGIWPLTNS